MISVLQSDYCHNVRLFYHKKVLCQSLYCTVAQRLYNTDFYRVNTDLGLFKQSQLSSQNTPHYSK